MLTVYLQIKMQMLTATINVGVDDDALKPMWEQMLTVDINVGVDAHREQMLTFYINVVQMLTFYINVGADVDS